MAAGTKRQDVFASAIEVMRDTVGWGLGRASASGSPKL